MQRPYSSYDYPPVACGLPAGAPASTERQADAELLDAILAGKYCHVLNAKRTGKSDLRVWMMDKLQAQGIACAELELSGIGNRQMTARQWYGGIIQELNSGFDLKLDGRSWLRERDDLTPVQRLSAFIEEVLLVQIRQNLVIFIDDIERVRSLSFPADEFFDLIRDCYDKRASNPHYRRLSFVLLELTRSSLH